MDTVTEEARGAAVAAQPADRDDRSAAYAAPDAPSASDRPPPSSGDASQPSVSCPPRKSAAGETAAMATAMAAAAAAATELAALTTKQAGTDQSESGARDPNGSKAKPKPKQKSNPRWAKMEDADGLDELLEGVYDNEDELVAKLMQQLQGLSHKQQRLYGIWDGTTDGGRRAFVEQWRRRHAERRAMVAGMHDPVTPPTERMALRTSYILRWRKVLFSCPGCWLLPGLCVCGRMQRFTPQRTRIVVHAHHGEWGSASNSGSILPTSLEGSEILLYGHPDHDARMREILNDPSRTTALLWPGSDSLLPEQLSSLGAERTGGRLTVVALDATWGNARRMQGWFPKGTLTVRLPPESTLKENKLSLLRPVRRYRGDLESGRVSTVEAVASLLYELEGDEAMYRGLLDNLKIKVDACRLQKNLSLVYDTHAPEQPSERHRWRRERAREAGSGGEGGSGDSESETNAGEAEGGVPGT